MVIGMQTNPLAWVRVTVVALLLNLLVSCSLFGGGKSRSVVDDTALVNAVENAFHQDRLLEGAPIRVQSQQGVIELTGRVESVGMKSRAGLLAASVPRVVQVHNDLLTLGLADH